MRRTMKRLVILISGRGSNMAAMLDAVRAGGSTRNRGVISNRPDAGGLEIATAAGVATAVVDHRAFPDRDDFERALAAAIDALAPDLVVLAGFMRILTPAFVARYAGRMLNIHPSLLPAYPGLETHRRALEDGVIHGCTVHFVTPSRPRADRRAGRGAGARRDDEAALAARVLAVEHRILVAAVRWFCEDRLSSRALASALRAKLPTPAVLPAPSDKATNSPPS